jgi:hypothetical protein
MGAVLWSFPFSCREIRMMLTVLAMLAAGGVTVSFAV